MLLVAVAAGAFAATGSCGAGSLWSSGWLTPKPGISGLVAFTMSSANLRWLASMRSARS